MKYSILPLSLAVLTACQSSEKSEANTELPAPHVQVESFVGYLELNDSTQVPFNFDWDGSSFVIHNGEERIVATDIETHLDSLFINMPVFQAGIEAEYINNEWNGEWVKYDSESPYRVPFTAKMNQARFETGNPSENTKLHSTYRFELRTGAEDAKDAIGEFQQEEDGTLYGTFRTATGDYRYLQGAVNGNTFNLSKFDGTLAYLFTGTVDGDTLRGMHYSGLTYARPFKAWIEAGFELPDPTQLTHLKEGYSSVSFEAINAKTDETFTYNSTENSGPVIIQIMGSWCPNCIDETGYFKTLHARFAERGLTILGLSFERSADYNVAKGTIAKMVSDLNIPYDVYFAGRATGESIAQVLPAIDNFMSYPTSIILDAKGNVVSIHTGFAGPGTSKYQSYVEETDALIESLLND